MTAAHLSPPSAGCHMTRPEPPESKCITIVVSCRTRGWLMSHRSLWAAVMFATSACATEHNGRRRAALKLHAQEAGKRRDFDLASGARKPEVPTPCRCMSSNASAAESRSKSSCLTSPTHQSALSVPRTTRSHAFRSGMSRWGEKRTCARRSSRAHGRAALVASGAVTGGKAERHERAA